MTNRRDDVPDVDITYDDALALYDLAIQREELERADKWADLLLRRFDPEDAEGTDGVGADT